MFRTKGIFEKRCNHSYYMGLIDFLAPFKRKQKEERKEKN